MKINRKLFFISCLVIIIIVAFIVFCFLSNNITISNAVNSTSIIEELKNKEDMLIYVYEDDNDNCLFCDTGNKIISYYKEVYGLEFTYYNTSKVGDKDLDKLSKYLHLDIGYVTAPAVIMIKGGELKAVANEMSIEDDFKKLLLDNNYISEDKVSLVERVTNEKFNDLLSSNEETLIYFSNGSDKAYKYRTILAKEAIKNNFSFKYINYGGVEGGSDIYTTLMKKISDLEVPALVIIKDNDIVDYIDNINNNHIKDFLKKHNYIN